jgi:hypothetical protein
VRCAKGCRLSTIYSLRAKQAIVSSSATFTKGRLESLIKAGSGVVLYTKRTLWAANIITLYTILTRPPSLVLTSTIVLFFLY